jgi:peptide/nickel transport system substrate-binding protein
MVTWKPNLSLMIAVAAGSLMCESLLRQAPDGSLQPGLATVSNPSPTTLVFTLRPGVRFWDGHPVTSADVVYSLGRQMNPKLGASYGWVFNRVASISATSQDQGKNYGTPGGSIMCTGAYMLKSWTPGVVAVRNPHYWNPSVHSLVGQITIKGVPSIASVTAGLETGAIQGEYGVGVTTLNQLRDNSSLKVYQGPGGRATCSS